MRGTAWRLYLGTGALATGVYYLLPYDPAGAILNLVVGASAAVAIAATAEAPTTTFRTAARVSGSR